MHDIAAFKLVSDNERYNNYTAIVTVLQCVLLPQVCILMDSYLMVLRYLNVPSSILYIIHEHNAKLWQIVV